MSAKQSSSKKISSKQLKELKKTFQMFDRDGNGKISATELAHAFRVQGQNIPDSEIRQIIREVDADGSGQIEFEEFVTLMMSKSRETQKQPSRDEAEMREAFKVFDQNGDGKISCKELKCVLNSIGEKMTEKEFAELIREADTDGDGSISFEARTQSEVKINATASVYNIGEIMTEKEFAELIRKAEGDGSISFEEFSKVLAHKFV